MARELVPTRNRDAIYHLMKRARRFHCPVTGVWEIDVTDLEQRLRAVRIEGRPISLVTCLVKATALVVEEQPRLNHHLFHRFFRRLEVAFDTIRCNLILQRKGPAGERILLPCIVESPQRMSLDEIAAFIEGRKAAPLDELPEYQGLERFKRLPRPAMAWFSYKARSDPAFYERYFGSYGLSSLMTRGWGGIGASTYANTAVAFIPGTLARRPAIHDGEVVPRRIMSIGCVADHYVLDGHEVMQAMKSLKGFLDRPETLGL